MRADPWGNAEPWADTFDRDVRALGRIGRGCGIAAILATVALVALTLIGVTAYGSPFWFLVFLWALAN